jgi:DNA replication protein DnaC
MADIIVPKWRTRQVYSTPEVAAKYESDRIKAAGIPIRYREADLKNCPQMDAIFEENSSYYLHGEVGVGKSYTLCAMVRERTLARTWCWYSTAIDMVDDIIRCYNRPQPKHQPDEDDDLDQEGRRRPHAELLWERDTEKFYRTVTVLALDDLGGIGYHTPFNSSILSKVIDHRYANCRVTYVASNLDLNGVAKIFDDRMASRLHEMCVVVNVKGKDKR